jgi:hypothetical protein
MTMSWELKYSVIANANRQTVWEFVSNIDNLARIEGDAVESITLDRPYQAGTTGTRRCGARNRYIGDWPKSSRPDGA